MAGETTITVIGNLTADPETRFTPSGAAVCSFTVASTPRTYDKASGEWKDGQPLFLRCNVWRQTAENIANSLNKGDRVIVQGALKQRSYETDGEKRTIIELEVDDIGASLKFREVQVKRAERQQAPAADPWGQAPPAPAGGGQHPQPDAGLWDAPPRQAPATPMF